MLTRGSHNKLHGIDTQTPESNTNGSCVTVFLASIFTAGFLICLFAKITPDAMEVNSWHKRTCRATTIEPVYSECCNYGRCSCVQARNEWALCDGMTTRTNETVMCAGPPDCCDTKCEWCVNRVTGRRMCCNQVCSRSVSANTCEYSCGTCAAINFEWYSTSNPAIRQSVNDKCEKNDQRCVDKFMTEVSGKDKTCYVSDNGTIVFSAPGYGKGWVTALVFAILLGIAAIVSWWIFIATLPPGCCSRKYEFTRPSTQDAVQLA